MIIMRAALLMHKIGTDINIEQADRNNSVETDTHAS